MAFHDPRPYWENPEIDSPSTCSDIDYGNPSGHVPNSTTTATLIQLDLHRMIKSSAKLSACFKSIVFRVILLLLSI